MFDQILRLPKERILEPIARGALKDVSPTTVTIAACGVGVAAGVSASQGLYGVTLGLWFFNRFLDGLDGTIARINHKQSDFGGYLDIVLDMIAYIAIPLGMAFSVGTTAVFVTLAIMFAIFYLNSASWMMLSAYLEKRNAGALLKGELTSVTMPRAIIEGAESIVMYSLFILLPANLPLLFSVMAGLVFVSAGWQIGWAYILLNKNEKNEQTNPVKQTVA